MKRWFLLLAALLLVGCSEKYDANVGKHSDGTLFIKIKPASPVVAGYLSDYLSVVDADYTFTEDGYAYLCTIKVKANKKLDGVKFYERIPQKMTLNACDGAGTPVSGVETLEEKGSLRYGDNTFALIKGILSKGEGEVPIEFTVNSSPNELKKFANEIKTFTVSLVDEGADDSSSAAADDKVIKASGESLTHWISPKFTIEKSYKVKWSFEVDESDSEDFSIWALNYTDDSGDYGAIDFLKSTHVLEKAYAAGEKVEGSTEYFGSGTCKLEIYGPMKSLNVEIERN